MQNILHIPFLIHPAPFYFPEKGKYGLLFPAVYGILGVRTNGAHTKMYSTGCIT